MRKKPILPDVTNRSKWPIFFIVFALCCSLYVFSNRFHFGEPVLLPTLPIDVAVPFLDWTVVIYLSHLFFMCAVVAVVHDGKILTPFIYSLTLGNILSALIFIFFPTQMTRVDHSFSATLKLLFDLLYFVDHPANCFPSLHIYWVTLGIYAVILQNYKYKFWMILWGVLINISTLTTKQHYFIDIFGALVLNWICWKVIQLLEPSG